jgi:hypothetical protein
VRNAGLGLIANKPGVTISEIFSNPNPRVKNIRDYLYITESGSVCGGGGNLVPVRV